MDSNSGIGIAAPVYSVMYGDWRVMFTGLKDIEKVTADDVQRVAKQYFTDENRTVVHTVKQTNSAQAASRVRLLSYERFLSRLFYSSASERLRLRRLPCCRRSKAPAKGQVRPR